MVQLRLLQPADRERAFRYVHAYYDHEGLLYTPPVEAAIDQLLTSPSLGCFYEILNGDDATGYVVLTFGFDHEFGGRFGLVTDFFLKEDWRSQGIGGRVLDALDGIARDLGLHHLELVVLEHNPRGRAFYERNRFVAVEGRTAMIRPTNGSLG